MRGGEGMRKKISKFDEAIIRNIRKYGHFLHRISLGLLFIWIGLLKPLGHKTTTSLLADTIYWASPDRMVMVLGLWEIIIGLCLIIRPLVRVALFLMVIRLLGILLAFYLKQDVCFYQFPFAPTPEGQYLIKDLVVFFAALAIAGHLKDRSTPHLRH